MLSSDFPIISRAEAVSRKQGQPRIESRIDLHKGHPNGSLIPIDSLLESAHEVLTDNTINVPALQYGPDPGWQPLRESLSKWLTTYYEQERDDVERICITGGASQNLACILQTFTDTNITKRIWTVGPVYHLACPIFEDAGFAGRLRACVEDEEGIEPEALEEEIRKVHGEEARGPPTKADRAHRKTYDHIIYCIPTFSNPSTKTMSLKRRRQLLEIARKYNALIITDDVYDFLYWPSSPSQKLNGEYSDAFRSRALLPRITDIERRWTPTEDDPENFGHAVSNGSFSKILGPGLRTGWVDATPKFAYGLSQTGSSKSGGCGSQIAATFVDRMIRARVLQQHISKTLVPTYQRRYQLMMQTLEAECGPLGVKLPEPHGKNGGNGKEWFGGYFIWIELPSSMPAGKFVKAIAAEEFNLAVSDGCLYEVPGDEQQESQERFLRLCFAYETLDNIVEGVQRLAQAMKECMKMPKEQASAMLMAVNVGNLSTTIASIDKLLANPPAKQFAQVEALVGIETTLPPIGEGLRAALARGFGSDVEEDMKRQYWNSLRELEEKMVQARNLVFNNKTEDEVEAQVEQFHLAAGKPMLGAINTSGFKALMGEAVKAEG